MFYNFIILATSETLMKTAESHDWLPTLGAIGISILTAVFSWWKNRPKAQADQFKVFMDESSDFRDEIRHERENLKKDLKDSDLERHALIEKLREHQRKLDECTQITLEQKEELEKLQQQINHLKENKNFKEILDEVPHIVWVSDKTGNVNYYNARAYQYTNKTAKFGMDIGYLKAFHPDDVADFMRIWENCVNTGEPYFFEYRLRRGFDGMYRWHLGMAIPRINNEGVIYEWVGTVTDIHDYKTGIIPHRGVEFEIPKNANG